jgi:hypothetical protein
MNKICIRTFGMVVLFGLFLNLTQYKNNVYGYNKIPEIVQIQLEYSKLYEAENQSIEVLTRYPKKVQYRIWLYSEKQNRWKEITKNYTEAVCLKNI